MASRRRDIDADSASSDEGVGYSPRGSAQGPRRLFSDTGYSEPGQPAVARHTASSGGLIPQRATGNGYAPAPTFVPSNGAGSRRPLPPGPARGGGRPQPFAGGQISAHAHPFPASPGGSGGHPAGDGEDELPRIPPRSAHGGGLRPGLGATAGQLRPLPAGPPPAQAISRPHSFASIPVSGYRAESRVYRRPEGSSTASLAQAVKYMRQQSSHQLSRTPSRSAMAAATARPPADGSGSSATFNPALAAVASAARIVASRQRIAAAFSDSAPASPSAVVRGRPGNRVAGSVQSGPFPTSPQAHISSPSAAHHFAPAGGIDRVASAPHSGTGTPARSPSSVRFAPSSHDGEVSRQLTPKQRAALVAAAARARGGQALDFSDSGRAPPASSKAHPSSMNGRVGSLRIDAGADEEIATAFRGAAEGASAVSLPTPGSDGVEQAAAGVGSGAGHPADPRYHRHMADRPRLAPYSAAIHNPSTSTSSVQAPLSPAIHVSAGGAMEQSFQHEVGQSRRKSLRPRHLLNKALKASDPEWQEKRARKKDEKRIHERHRLHHLSYGMMLGMWVAMNRFKDAGTLHIDDFNRVQKLFFPREGTAETPQLELPHSFKFKDYAPRVFRHLRERFGVNADEYKRSLGGFYDFIEFQSNSKSGQFFFFSHDGRFMIKTQSHEESTFLRRIIPHYFRYVVENPYTFLPRFYGLHRIKMAHIGLVRHFTVMHSVYDASIYDDLAWAKYDLKGSWVGRRASAKDLAKPAGQCVFKDVDLAESGVKFRIGANRAVPMLEQLRKDAAFLQSMQIMDYSLLVGIRDRITEEDAYDMSVAYARAASEGPAGDGGDDDDGEARDAEPTAADIAAANCASKEAAAAARKARRERRRSHVPRAHVLATSRPGESPHFPTFARSGHSAFNVTEGSAGEYGASASSLDSVDGDDGATDRYTARATAAAAAAVAATAPSGAEARAAAAEPGSPTPAVPPADDFADPPPAGVPASHAAVVSVKEDGSLGTEVYNFGIIDILQQYNIRKNVETAWRGLTGVRAGSSCVPPKEYAKRFVDFMEDAII